MQGRLTCLVSIGTGVPTRARRRLGNLGYPKRARNQDRKTAKQFYYDKSNLDEGRYYCFNVDYILEDIGLEESKKREIAAATGR